MNTHKPVGKFLAATVLCSLFTASPVWAASLTTTSTVNESNTQENPYSSITVTGNGSKVAGIALPTATEMTVYVEGNKVLQVTSTDQRNPGNSDANGTIGVVNAPYYNGITYSSTIKTLNIKGTLSGVIEAKANANERSGKAYGLFVSLGKIITEDIGSLTVSAQNDAYGLNSILGGSLTTGKIASLDVQAVGKNLTRETVTGDSAYTVIDGNLQGWGLYNDKGSMQTGDIGTLTVTVQTGAVTTGNATATKYGANASAISGVSAAAGIQNINLGKTSIGNIGSLTVTGVAGKATAGNASGDGNYQPGAFATASSIVSGVFNYGVNDNGQTILNVGNIGSLTASAVGGDAVAGTVTYTANAGATEQDSADSSAATYGFYNRTGTLTVGDAQGLKISAVAGNATIKEARAGLDASASAYGIYASTGGTTNITGNLEITDINAKAGTRTDENNVTATDRARAFSLYATGTGSVINVGVNTEAGYPTGNGKTVKLLGDVGAYENGTNNLILYGDGSYLQGNILTDGGTNHVTVTSGATWKPVYDNRYGSFSVAGDAATYALATKVSAVATSADLTLSNKGRIDLAWDDATRDPATTARTMTLSSLSGADGVLVVNTNLAQSVADQFIITNNSATSLGIDVNYDPALTTSGLDNNSDISGSAKVLTISSGTTPAVTGVSDSYNTYDYTPTITNNGDNTWSVTKLTITNKTPVDPTNPTNPAEPTNPTDNPTTPTKTTITSPSRPMRDARHQRMALHNLWVNGELNNMEKRLGDLRAVEPAEAGIWARYEYNKLEKGSNANLKYNYFQLGYDKDFKGDTCNFYRGVAFSYGKGDGSYEVGTGDLKEGAMTLYQTWVGKSGNYYDIVAKAGKLLNDYNAVATANPYTSDYHSWAYSIGGEVGKRFKKNNGFFVEPQFEFTLCRINGADYTTSTGMNVNVDAQNSAIARIGVAVGKEIKNVGSYYAKASYFHDFGGGLNLTASDSTTNPFSYGEDSAKNWCIFTLGGAVKASKNCNVFGELSKYTGELSNNIQVNVGARWSF